MKFEKRKSSSLENRTTGRTETNKQGRIVPTLAQLEVMLTVIACRCLQLSAGKSASNAAV
jgi:hypothetical protein